MILSEHFTKAEFEASDIARRLRIDNTLPEELLENARRTALMLERIRTHLSQLSGGVVPLIITSGYRCFELNRALKSTGLDHPQAKAADWRAPLFGTPFLITRELMTHIDALSIGQLIHEFPGPNGTGWVHTSTERPALAINRAITIDTTAAGDIETRPGIWRSFT